MYIDKSHDSIYETDPHFNQFDLKTSNGVPILLHALNRNAISFVDLNHEQIDGINYLNRMINDDFYNSDFDYKNAIDSLKFGIAKINYTTIDNQTWLSKNEEGLNLIDRFESPLNAVHNRNNTNDEWMGKVGLDWNKSYDEMINFLTTKKIEIKTEAFVSIDSLTNESNNENNVWLDYI